jgi:ABC-type sugar transport system permease subunit
MKILIKIWNKIQNIIGWVLGIWLLAGILGFWKLLPNNIVWTVVKIASAMILAFALLMKVEESEDKPFKVQLKIVGSYILGAVVLFIFMEILYLVFFNDMHNGCLPYFWESCP